MKRAIKGTLRRAMPIREHIRLVILLFCSVGFSLASIGQNDENPIVGSGHQAYSAEGMLMDLKQQLDTVSSPSERCLLLNNYSFVHMMLGQWDEALPIIDSAYALAKSLDDYIGLSLAHENYGAYYQAKGAYDRSLYHYRIQLALTKNHPHDSLEIGNKLHLLASNQLDYGLYYNALDTLEIALGILEKHGSALNIANCLNTIAVVYRELGEFELGQEYQDRSIGLLDEDDGLRSYTTLLLNKASWLMQTGKYAESHVFIDRAATFIKNKGYQEQLGRVQSVSGELAAYTGEFQRAASLHLEAHEALVQSGDSVYMMDNLLYLAKSYKALGKYDEALQAANHLSSIMHLEKSQKKHAQVHLLLSKLLELTGDTKGAYSELGLYLKTQQSADSLAEMKQARNLEARFRNGQQKIALLEKDKELVFQADEIIQKNNRLKLLGFGALALACLTVLIIIAYRQRIKSQAQSAEIELNQALIESTEEERERIANELHDGTGSLLTGIKLGLEHLQGMMTDSNQVKQLNTTISQVQNVAKEVRRVSHAMAPTAIERLPFEEVIADLINAFSHIGKAEIDYSPSGDFEQMNKTERLMLYRIMQECLNNSFKHADASEINISLMATEGEIEMLYQDNGKGYDPSKTDRGLGLSSIEKRIHYLHGKQTLETESGSGMLLILNFPILRA